jgi:hypothetical protein
MPFFVDEFGHTVFPAGITADNLETAKRHALPRPRAMGAEVWPLQSYPTASGWLRAPARRSSQAQKGKSIWQRRR